MIAHIVSLQLLKRNKVLFIFLVLAHFLGALSIFYVFIQMIKTTPCHAMSCHVQVPPAIPTPGTSSAAAIGATDISPAAPREPTPEGP